jgi:serpin B
MNRSRITLLVASFFLLVSWLFTQNYFKTKAIASISNQNYNVTEINTNNYLADSSMKDMDQRLVNANREFAFKLFSQVNQQDQNQNIFVSPTSVSIALSLLYNGADGQTQQQMAQVLELQGMKLEEINQAYQSLQNLLENQPEVELSIANSLWLKQGFPVESEFLANNKKYYQAEIKELDFSQPDSKDIINNWVATATNDKITEIIDSIDPRDVFFLINAIYFKGTWTTQFDPQLTETKPFYLNNNQKINHALMSQRGNFSYYENDQFQAINLPYGESQNLSMYIFLPKKNSNLDKFLKNLTSQNWQEWGNNFSKQEGFISIPKFKLEYEITLNDTLKSIGMTDIFSNYANFKKMTTEEVFVNEVKHKTFIDVNEEGTEAAAVTSVGIRTTSVQINEPFTMIVDRPFFYAICDNKTDTILFMGKVLNPSK